MRRSHTNSSSEIHHSECRKIHPQSRPKEARGLSKNIHKCTDPAHKIRGQLHLNTLAAAELFQSRGTRLTLIQDLLGHVGSFVQSLIHLLLVFQDEWTNDLVVDGDGAIPGSGDHAVQQEQTLQA